MCWFYPITQHKFEKSSRCFNTATVLHAALFVVKFGGTWCWLGFSGCRRPFFVIERSSTNRRRTALIKQPRSDRAEQRCDRVELPGWNRNGGGLTCQKYCTLTACFNGRRFKLFWRNTAKEVYKMKCHAQRLVLYFQFPTGALLAYLVFWSSCFNWCTCEH